MNKESDIIKEVYARFGLAYYQSEVLHRGLCNIYALASFDSLESITRPRMEEKFSYAYSFTLGRLINEIKELFPPGIQQNLDLALSMRNYLAHHFWFEKNYLMFSDDGLLQLQEELREYFEFFDNLDNEINEFFRPIQQDFGMTDEIIQHELQKILEGEPDEPLIDQRMLNKQEKKS
jgi:hypothetical protein